MMTATPGSPPAAAHAVARALTIGLRTWSFYPPEHPAVALALDRLVASIGSATAGGLLQLAVTPHTLLVAGVPVESPDTVVAECARQLYERDILQITFSAPSPTGSVSALLRMLTMERAERRAKGGPAQMWGAEGHPSIILEQIDYQELLEREEDEGPARRDLHWKSIVQSIIAGRRTFTEAEQHRLLEISHDVGAIGELASDCMGSFVTPDGSPLVTTQAATVLAVYRHLTTTVAVLEPDRVQELMGSLSVSTSALDPTLALEVLTQKDIADDPQKLMQALRGSFDDHQVAMLLARALSRQTAASSRLAQIVETLAPDEERRRRVLRLADRLLTERDFGATRPLADIKASLEELLLKYDESPFVSAQYRQSMDQSVDRATEIAARDLPPDLGDWLETLNHESVRHLSAVLLTDLLRIETDHARAAEIASDIAAFAQDLIMGGAYDEARQVSEALATTGARRDAPAPAECLQALHTIGASVALREAVTAMSDLGDADADVLAALCETLGPGAVPALLNAMPRDTGGALRTRLIEILTRLGPAAVPALSHVAEETRWWILVAVAETLGRIGGAPAVPALQAMLRRPDKRVLGAAVAALAKIGDPAAARALHTVLRAATGDARGTVIAALVALKDSRTVPMLVRILQESELFGPDFPVVLDTLAAMAELGDDRTVGPVAATARARRWFAWGRTRQLRERALASLAGIGTPAAQSALDDLARNGDWMLRRMLRSHAGGRR